MSRRHGIRHLQPGDAERAHSGDLVVRGSPPSGTGAGPLVHCATDLGAGSGDVEKKVA